jgi:predicted protein tyrosine phosphatase
VHCLAGISRSVSVILGVLIKILGNYDFADKHIRIEYPQSQPNPFFISILVKNEWKK